MKKKKPMNRVQSCCLTKFQFHQRCLKGLNKTWCKIQLFRWSFLTLESRWNNQVAMLLLTYQKRKPLIWSRNRMIMLLICSRRNISQLCRPIQWLCQFWLVQLLTIGFWKIMNSPKSNSRDHCSIIRSTKTQVLLNTCKVNKWSWWCSHNSKTQWEWAWVWVECQVEWVECIDE